MYKLLAMTNRKLCNNDFLKQIENIARNKPEGIVLREKDLSKDEYENLAIKVMSICEKYDIDCILHTYYDVAIKLNCDKIHVPIHVIRENPSIYKYFKVIGVSIHSVEEAKEAQKLGATYITAGHIFKTDCKKGLEPRGIEFLTEVCKAVNIPVFAIGGITKDKINSVLQAGAKGVCMMSEVMRCNDFKKLNNIESVDK